MRTFFTCCIVAVACLVSVHTAAAAEKTVRLLTIGNSFADNALAYLPQIVEASGNELIVGKANIGGGTLKQHWEAVEKHEADPDDPAGRIYERKFSLEDQLTVDAWDYVTLQQASWLSHDLGTFHPYIEQLYDYVRGHAPQAKILIHQTWAYRADDPRFAPDDAGTVKDTPQRMYEQVRQAYHTIAEALSLDILPSGDAMYAADTDPTWGFKPVEVDPAAYKHPQLPDSTHSLHIGWQWRTDKQTGTQQLSLDGHHAGAAGHYLIGCVWFEVLFEQSVVDNSFVPRGLAPEYAQFLRQTAHDTVARLKAGR